MIRMKIVSHKLSLEERKARLINEAISRGLVDGARFTSPQDGKWYEISDHSKSGGQELYRFVEDRKNLLMLASISSVWSEYIYYDGKWATLSNFVRSWEVNPDKKFWNPNRL